MIVIIQPYYKISLTVIWNFPPCKNALKLIKIKLTEAECCRTIVASVNHKLVC